MRGVQVRGAGGLLIGVCIQPIVRIFDYRAYDDGVFDAFRAYFWFPPGASPPGDMVPFVLVRAALVFGGIVLGALGVAGLRAARYPIVVVSALLVLGILPWVIWPFDARTFEGAPPDWVFEHPLWWSSSRGMSLILLAMLVAAVVLALLDRGTRPAVAGTPPPYGPAPYGQFGPAPAPAVTGPWMSADVMGPPRPNPPPPSASAPPPAGPTPEDAPARPDAPAPPDASGSRPPPTPF